MPYEMKLGEGEGSVNPNPQWTEGSSKPSWLGEVRLKNAAKPEQKEPTLGLSIAMWTREGEAGRYYSMSIGGTPAQLFKNKEKRPGTKDWDLYGKWGDMVLRAWVNDNNPEKPYIKIYVHEPKPKEPAQPAQSAPQASMAPAGKAAFL